MYSATSMRKVERINGVFDKHRGTEWGCCTRLVPLRVWWEPAVLCRLANLHSPHHFMPAAEDCRLPGYPL